MSSQHIIQTTHKLELQTNRNLPEMITILDYVCCKIAEKYELYSVDGKPRKATIMSELAQNTCLGCINKGLQTKNFQRIDSIYNELHHLAASMLIEELHSQLIKKGHKVTIAAEAPIKYGTADILIIPSNHYISVHKNQVEIVVEIKTGYTLSVPQLLRYLIESDKRSLILWRIRNEQVLLLEGLEIRQLVCQFVRMIVSRADRLLQVTGLECNHAIESKPYSPNSQQLQETFDDFSKNVIRTLPSIVEAVVATLEKEVK